MELWIRSQDKYTLMKIEEIQICENPDGTWFMNAGLVLGKYKTKKRALEVLDEIHQRLINLATLEIAPDSYKVLPKDTSNVYEMPKE